MTSGNQTFLSICLPYLAAERLLRRSGASAEAPFATVAKVKGALRLAGLDRRARRLGLKPGMSLADARAMHPALVVAEGDAAAEAELLCASADWCRRWTPLAALDGPDGVMLDITGAAHLFGGETAMIADIEAQFRRQGLSARAAIAATPEAAFALARLSQMKIAPQTERERTRLFDDLPLAALRLDADALQALEQAGLRRVGDVRLRPRAPIAARFGAHVPRRVDALFGLTKSAISPRFEAPPYMVERRFAEPIARSEDIEGTLARLAADLVALLERHGEGARHLDADFFRVDGMTKHLDAGASRPLRDPAAMTRLFRERIDSLGEKGLETGYGFDVIRLSARRVERFDAPQADLAQGPRESEDLADLIDRLGARLGLRRVTRLSAEDTHWPDFAVTSVPAAQAPRRTRRFAEPARSAALPARPLRLFAQPEPIDAMAAVPDGPPVRFRWRRLLHDVAAIEGPERIAAEWWASDAMTRDYFRAEDKQGRRFWLYREGLYGRETQQPRWFMHGLFG